MSMAPFPNVQFRSACAMIGLTRQIGIWSIVSQAQETGSPYETIGPPKGLAGPDAF